MDERLRDLERQYLSLPDGETLLQILRHYARIGDIPTGDIRALELLQFKKIIPKKRGVEAHGYDAVWFRQLDMEKIKELEALGYPIGVYFEMSCPVVESKSDPRFLGTDQSPEKIFERITLEISEILIAESAISNYDQLRGLHDVDSVDDLDISPGNAHARTIQDDGRPLWEHNLDKVTQQRQQNPNLLNTIRTFSSILGVIQKKKQPNKVQLRIFVPVDALERAYAVEITQHRQGFSRSTVRNRASSQISWGIPTQVATLKSTMNNTFTHPSPNVGLSFNCIAQNFGCNLLLALSVYYRFRKSWLD